MRNPSEIQVNGTTLDVVLADHLKWLRDDGGLRADLQDADLQVANLQDADLQGANLRHANLHGANLQGADLRQAKLQLADLQVANLQDADLQDANLQDANLHGANLHGANLHGANLDNSRIVRMDFGSWSVCITRDSTQIGCQRHPNEKWLEWEPESKEIENMHHNATQFWTDHKDMIRAGIRWAMAEPTKEG